MKTVKVSFLAIITVCLLMIMVQQSGAQTLLMEHFNTDVIGSGDWTASDGSVNVDSENSWLRIGSNGAVDDFADKYGPFPLPLVIEWRERTYTGDPGIGPYFSLPKLELWWGPSRDGSYHITYTDIDNTGLGGWLFGGWTNILTLGPTNWNQWRTVKAIIRSDGGELFVKQDGVLDFTPIATKTWTVPSEISRIRLSQNSDNVSDFDYVRVTTFDQQTQGWCDGFEGGLVDWTPYQYPSGWTATTSNPHSGQTCAAFTFPSGARYYDASMRSNTGLFNVEAGVTYRVTYWIREQNTRDTWDPNASILDMNLIDGGANNRIAPFLLPISSEWHFVEGTVTASVSGPASIDVQLHGYATASEAVFAIDDICIAPFVLPDFSSLSGFVTGPDGGLLGVSVDIIDSEGQLHASTTTDEVGHYSFAGVPNGVYTVGVAVPMGYQAVEQFHEVELLGLEYEVDFALTRLEVPLAQRGRGYWMHEVNALVSSKGNAHETYQDMCNYMELIRSHFNEHGLNPVSVFLVDLEADCASRLDALQTAISPIRKESMNNKARAHLTVLLLNLVSGKIAQWAVISEDGATVSQAITYCNTLISDPYPENDEMAKNIAEMMNEGQIVPGGMIDPSTPDITYRRGSELPTHYSLDQNSPNPFNPTTKIAFSVPGPASVRLEVFNVAGQRVAVLIEANLPAGYHTVVWDAGELASGVYLYRLAAGEFMATKKMVLLK